MATVHIVLARADVRAMTGTTQPVINAEPVGVDTITSSSSSQQADITVPQTTAGYGLYWQVTASGGDIWAKFGSNPTAAAEEGFLILDGTTREFGAAPTQKCAVVDA